MSLVHTALAKVDEFKHFGVLLGKFCQKDFALVIQYHSM